MILLYSNIDSRAGLIDGIRVYDIKKNIDERGFFAELLRQDWRDLLHKDHVVAFSLSYSKPGVIRAWHRHTRGQNDYVVCIGGSIKECVFDDRKNSATRGELDEITLNGNGRLQVARVVGACWHGFKVLNHEAAMILYGVTKLYNYRNPDEKRRPWNDESVVPASINGRKNDNRVGRPYDWNEPSHS